MRSPRLLAIDFGASHVTCGVFAAGSAGRLMLEKFARMPLDPDPGLETDWPAELAHSLDAMVGRYDFTGAASVAVPGHLVLTKFIKVSTGEERKRENIIAGEAARHIPFPLDDVVWDCTPVTDDGTGLELVLSAVKRDTMESLCAAADSAGISIERAVPAGHALGHAFRHHDRETKESVATMNIGARSTTIVFLDGGRIHHRTLVLAGNSVTQAVAGALKIGFSEAEALKVHELSGNSDHPADVRARAAVRESVATFAARLHLEYLRATVNFGRQSGGAAPAALYLTGGGSLIPGLPALLAEKLKLRVELHAPHHDVDLTTDARSAGADVPMYLSAELLGLATRLVAGIGREASLLPPAIATRVAFRRRQPFILAAAGLLAVALLPPLAYFHRLANTANFRIVQIEGRLAPLRALRERNDSNRRQIDEVNKRRAGLRRAGEARFGWLDFFGELQARLAEIENVWIDKLQLVHPAWPPSGAGRVSADPVAQPAVREPFRLALSGRLLDVNNPQAKVSAESFERVKQLLLEIRRSSFVSAVEGERFDNSRDGLLRFDFTLVINPENPL